ncbi:hypothetical protein T492DRAFT_1146893 [Pavlovales sp. CCMP2436]|nr:hypothetical protein T492DRAFT_1146893 [Pavlovales sp. CCMP2436]
MCRFRPSPRCSARGGASQDSQPGPGAESTGELQIVRRCRARSDVLLITKCVYSTDGCLTRRPIGLKWHASGRRGSEAGRNTRLLDPASRNVCARPTAQCPQANKSQVHIRNGRVGALQCGVDNGVRVDVRQRAIGTDAGQPRGKLVRVGPGDRECQTVCWPAALP